MTQTRVLFLTEANNSVGLGHLKRCICLARAERLVASEVFFILVGDLSGYNYLVECGFSDKTIILVDSISRVCEQVAKKYWDLIITDLVHKNFFSCKSYMAMHSSLSMYCKQLAALDTLGEESLYKLGELSNIGTLIIPYIGAPDKKLGAKWTILSGPDYAILGTEYLNAERLEIKNDVCQVLVSCGGSDPNEDTLKILQSIEVDSAYYKEVCFRIVLGPLVSQAAQSRIIRYSEASTLRISFSFSPPTLLEELLSSDVLISASGLTKYEAAAIGIPMIIFSMDKESYAFNRAFAKSGVCIDIGIGVQDDLLRSELRKLCQTRSTRLALSRKCKSLISRDGANRILNELL